MPWSLSYVRIDWVATDSWCPTSTQDLSLRLSENGEPTAIKIWNIIVVPVATVRWNAVPPHTIQIREVICPAQSKEYTLSARIHSYSNFNVVKLITVGFGDGGLISFNESNYPPVYHIRLSGQ